MAKLCEVAKTALLDRNSIMHGVVVELDGNLAIRNWGGKSKLTGEPELWPIEGVCDLAQRLLMLLDAIDELIDGFWNLKASELENNHSDD
jgi:hypothetical protein